MTALGSPLRSAVRDELVAEWRKLGAEVIATEAHPSELFSGYAQGGLLERGQFEAGLWTWSIGPDPDGVYPLEHSSQIPTDQNQGQGSNFGRFSNPDLDRNLDRGRTSLVTVERARSLCGVRTRLRSPGLRTSALRARARRALKPPFAQSRAQRGARHHAVERGGLVGRLKRGC